jgi:Family of unknown function (DUF6304)
MASWPATYRDRVGEVQSDIEVDGTALRIELRGVRFAGNDFDALEPERPLSDGDREQFTLVVGALCSCELTWRMQVEFLVNGQAHPAWLEARLELGAPKANGGITHEHLRLRLVTVDNEYLSREDAGWFEDALADIQRALPQGVVLKVCFGCAYSDYSPYGHGLWGTLACFRGNKSGYATVRSKSDVFRVWPTLTEYVAETHVCSEFAPRVAGTGYRG